MSHLFQGAMSFTVNLETKVQQESQVHMLCMGESGTHVKVRGTCCVPCFIPTQWLQQIYQTIKDT